jgi:tRNA-splicing endonuclease subunit Sen34
MAANAPQRQVRISRVAGRYLIFDIDDVVNIRRHHGICAVLTGTMPQNPTQNLFLGLPVELHAEEATLLVDKGVGYVADELTDHLTQLSAADERTRKAYLQHLKQQRKNAQQAFEEARAQVQAKHLARRKAAVRAKAEAEVIPTNPEVASSSGPEETDSLFDSPTPASTKPPGPHKQKQTPLPAITPTTSNPLVPATPSQPASTELDPAIPPSKYPLYKYLNARGYYTTPGLRFGGDFSVYPGDPFRYHAHYLANSYGWDEAVPLLDLVTSGRLGTAVKKSFLFGSKANRPVPEPTLEGTQEGASGDGEVRVFCIEWAGM